MRGPDHQQAACFSYLSPEDRVPADHPLRPIRGMVDRALRELSPTLGRLYARIGRPSIAPEYLLRASLLQIFYSVRSERLLMEQLDYNLLFRWFVGLSMDAPVWDHSTFSKNRDRLLTTDMAIAFFQRIKEQAEEAGLLSDEHFSVDGTLIEAWASLKSFQPRDEDPTPPADGTRNPTVDFHGTQRRNASHESTTDPEARLYRKATGQPAQLCYMGHVLMENRHGLVVDVELTPATGTAEREAAVAMLERVPGRHRITVGADKGYDTADFVATLRTLRTTPHVAQKAKGTAVDARTTRHPGYRTSLAIRKRVEESFGWLKTVAGARQSKLRGVQRVGWHFLWSMGAYNLIRMRNLLAPT